MDTFPDTLDWSHIRSFLAVAEHGSLSAAARATRQSQPTLGRHIKAAEQALGTALFTRVPAGVQLTDAGLSLLEPARAMAAASARFMTRAAGRDVRVSGTVRITASDVVSHYLLPRIIADLRRAEPQIEVELVPSNTTQNLIFRDADIAVRMFRPTQLDIVTRKIGDLPLALYGARDLVARVGNPQTLQDLERVPFVGYDRSEVILDQVRALVPQVDKHFFGVRCDQQAIYWELVRAGCGMGAAQTCIGDADSGVVRLGIQPPLPSLPMWLATQDALFKTPRVRRVWRMLVDGLGEVARSAADSAGAAK